MQALADLLIGISLHEVQFQALRLPIGHVLAHRPYDDPLHSMHQKLPLGVAQGFDVRGQLLYIHGAAAVTDAGSSVVGFCGFPSFVGLGHTKNSSSIDP